MHRHSNILDESVHSVMEKHRLSEDVTSTRSTERGLCVFGSCLENEHRRQEVLGRLQSSCAKHVRFSGVQSSPDLTLLLNLARQNPYVNQVELVGCELSSQHFENFADVTSLISCRLHEEATAATLDASCSRNTELTRLHIQDLVLDSALSVAVNSFRHFPSLQCFQLVTCHLPVQSYYSLTTFLRERKQQHQQPLRSLTIDLRVWNEKALQRTGLAHAIGSCPGLTELCLNGRILEQVDTDTMVTLCGTPNQQRRRRLRLTYQPQELRKGGDQLGQLVDKTQNLRSIDIAEMGTVTSLQAAQQQQTLAAFLTAVGRSMTIESLALPRLSIELSAQLAKSLSHSTSLRHVSAKGIAWTQALTIALRQNSKLVHFSAGPQKECHTKFVHECLQRNLKLPQVLRKATRSSMSSSKHSINNSRALLPHLFAASRFSHSTEAVQAIMELGDLIGAVV